MVFCAKIYNMTEFNPDQPLHSEFEAQPIVDAQDAIFDDIPEREQLERGMDWLLDRQKELYEEHQHLREQGQALTAEKEQELDDINHAMLELNHVLKKYQPEE